MQMSDLKGKYETDMKQLRDLLKDEPPEAIQHFDLKGPFAELLSSGGKLPRLAERIWRRVLDEAVSEFGGGYSPEDGTMFVSVWLEKLPTGAAKAKMPTLAVRMKDIYMKAHDKGPEAELDQLFVKVEEKDKRQAPQLSPEMAKLIKDGLTPNPSPEIFKLWLTRTMQGMSMAQQKTPFVKDIMEVVARADISYMPVWACANELLLGCFAHLRTSVPHASYTAAEPMRQDLLSLFAQCMQLSVMESKKVHAFGFLVLNYGTMMNKEAMDLVNAFMATLAPEVKKDLLLEVKGMPMGAPAPAFKTVLEKLAPHVKAYILDTGIFSKDKYGTTFPKLHATGFDVGGLSLPDVEIASLIRKYADTHKGQLQKFYIKGVSSPTILKIAKQTGFTYACGPAVHAAEKFLTGIRQFPIRLPD